MIKTYTSIPSVNENTILNVIIFAPNNEEDIKGMIQVCHGMTEHMDRYNKFAEYFTARGYVVLGTILSATAKASAIRPSVFIWTTGLMLSMTLKMSENTLKSLIRDCLCIFSDFHSALSL